MVNRVEVVQERIVRYLETAAAKSRLADDEPLVAGSTLTVGEARLLVADQFLSRLLDVEARRLKAEGRGYYTISSAGHEQNAIVGAQLRTSDPSFLHYRSGGFMMARSRQVPGIDPVRDTILSYVAAVEDPCSGGRHKVWGSRPLWIPPQTSTIASHIPKAVGMAFALGRPRRAGRAAGIPDDALTMCSFGDASAGHATALTGINAARYAFRKGSPMPILFVCEDNRVGISVSKPRRWMADTFSHLSQLTYILATGTLDQIWDRVRDAIQICREERRPVFLRLPTVRLWGHAGSDVETAYRTLAEIEAIEAQDPLLGNLRYLVDLGAADPGELLKLYRSLELRVTDAGRSLGDSPRLADAATVMAPLAPYDPGRCREAAAGSAPAAARSRLFGDELPEAAAGPTRRTLAAHLNSALSDEMLRRPEIVLFGEDVAKKGGVYYVTAHLLERFGPYRVFDTLLDETTILGMAQGMAHAGSLPVPEIQYLAYLHNAIDQLRGEACSLSFFSNGQFKNPMVVRIAAFAYQKGFGGHFHNDNAIAALCEIPGLLVCAPARGDDAARMLRGVLAMAAEDGRVACFLEPIALYHERDLYTPGDRGWLSDYPPPGEALLPGDVGVHHPEHDDVLIVTYANGVRMSLRAARELREQHGVKARVLDLRWLSPLPFDAIRQHASECAAVLVADECRARGGIADAVIAHLAEARPAGGPAQPLASVRSLDTYIPIGPAADLVLLSEPQIVEAAVKCAAAAGRR